MGNVIARGILFSFFCLFSFQSFAVSILGPKVFKASQPQAKVYNQSLTIPQNETQLNYKIIIKNGDGKAHPILTCNQSGFVQRLLCTVKNIPNTLYVEIFRVKSFELRNNNVVIIHASQINKNVASYTATLRLSQVNQLKFTVLGPKSSFVTVEIQKPLVSADTAPPLIAYNIQSNSIINTNTSRIIITDQSNTTTTLTNNGQLVLTSTSKSIDYILPEGTNNLVIQSIDAFGNQSQNYIVSQVTVDTKIPVIDHDLQVLYVISQLPYLKIITFTSNESLQSLQVDNNPVMQTGLNTYSFVAQFTAAGLKSFAVKATDLAGNITTKTISTEIKVDLAAPTIATNQIPSIIITNSFELNITISDESVTTTEIFINNLSVLSTTDKLINYTIPFPTDGTKNIKIVSTDPAGLSSMKAFTITKDTQPLNVSIISPQNQSIINTNIIEVRARANKLLSSAKINGELVQIDPDQVSIKTNIQQFIDGAYPILIEVTDITGATAQSQITVNIKSSSLPSWTYQECPVNP